jgi:hypothetical protein
MSREQNSLVIINLANENKANLEKKWLKCKGGLSL